MLVNPMKTSERGRSLIEQREGLRLHAYQDQRGVWTIGYGHTSAAGIPHVNPDAEITRKQADGILTHDLEQWEGYVNDCLKVQLSQNEFDACVSLCHNIGPRGFQGSTVVHMINSGHLLQAANAFLMWEKPSSLVQRRVSERKQFLNPDRHDR